MPTNSTSLSLTQTQLDTIRSYADPTKPNYPAMYQFIADEMKAGRMQGATSDQVYWFEQAAKINAGDVGSPASIFIREATREGLIANRQPASTEVINAISNSIGANVARDIISGGAIPPFSQQLQADISAAITAGGMTIGGWGGAFYYWNETWTDPRTGNTTTVGQAILNDPVERDKFVKGNAAAIAAVWNSMTNGDVGLNLNSVSAFASAMTRGIKNLAANGLPGGEIAGQLIDRAQASMMNSGGLFMQRLIDALYEASGVTPPYRLLSVDQASPTGGDAQAIANALAGDLTQVLVAGEGQPPDMELFAQVQQAIVAELAGRDLSGATVYGNVGGLYVVLLPSGEQVRVNAAGQVASTRIDQLDDGSTLTTNRSFDRSSVVTSVGTDGTTVSTRFDPRGTLTGRTEITPLPSGSVTSTFGADGRLLETRRFQGFDDGSIEVISRADGSEDRIITDSTGKIRLVTVPSYAATISSAIGDTTSLINAIKSGEPLPTVTSGLRLLNTLDRDHAIPGLSEAATVGQGLLSLYNLANALENGDALDKISAAGNAVVHTTAALTAAGATLPTAVTSFANSLNNALPPLALVVAIKNEDPIGAALSLGWMIEGSAFLTSNPIGWVLLAASLYKAMEEPPEAWGVGTFRFGTGTDLVLDTQGESFGKDRVNLLMLGNGQAPGTAGYFGGLEAYLRDEVVARAQQANPNLLLGIIPQRLPTVSWHEARQDEPGYAITDIDPATGQERYPFLRYNDDWTPYNADATDPEQRRNLFERMVLTSVRREAIAPMWEVQTARLQQDVGDPNAGLTEVVRAGRRGLLAPVDPLTNTASPGEFRPVALDLDGDGRVATVTDAANSRAFNWDGSGFDKNVGWVGASEGLLFLDRNPNGVVDSGMELFSNSAVADAAKGVRSLAWVDANADGLLNSLDPVFAQLRVWQDANGDAQSEPLELESLAALGISEIDYMNGRFTRNGQLFSMQSPRLETTSTGQRVSVVPDGVKVEFSDGRVLVYATAVADASQVARVSSVSDATAVEGGALDFTVTLNVPSLAGAAATLALYSGTASTSQDLSLPLEASFDGGQSYAPLADATLALPTGTTQFRVRVRSIDDAQVESTESVTLGVKTAANAAYVLGSGRIVDNDAAGAQLSVSGPAIAAEAAGALTYTVTLSQASSAPVTVDYATSAGSAQPGADFAAAAGTLVFAPGETSKTVTIGIIDDAQIEAAENFALTLSNASGATIAVGSAQTVIQDDDTPGGGSDAFSAGDDDLLQKNEDLSATPTTTPATQPVPWDLLLANDSFDGSNADLSIIAVGNGQHVQVSLDAQQRTVLVTPLANYVGQASFEYTVQAPTGDVRTATAFMTFTEVNDPPVTGQQLGTRTIYGWAPLVRTTVIIGGSDNGNNVVTTITPDQGEPIYAPYNTVQGQQVQQRQLNGESGSSEWESVGGPVDTGIPESYFAQRYADSVYRDEFGQTFYPAYLDVCGTGASSASPRLRPSTCTRRRWRASSTTTAA